MGDRAGHRSTAWALVVAVVLALAGGCRGAGSDTATPAPVVAPTSSATPTSPAPAHDIPRRPLRYVALGDSLASGLSGEPSYVDAYRRLLHRRLGRPVRLTNLGRPGWTSAQLLHALRTDDAVRSAVASADIVTWNIGGNDILRAALRSLTGACGAGAAACLRDAREHFTADWRDIVDELVALRSNRNVALQTIDLYTPFVTLPGVPHDAALAELRTMNATIHATARRQPVAVARVADAFSKTSGLIAADGVHPTHAGHRVIAQLLDDSFDPPR